MISLVLHECCWSLWIDCWKIRNSESNWRPWLFLRRTRPTCALVAISPSSPALRRWTSISRYLLKHFLFHIYDSGFPTSPSFATRQLARWVWVVSLVWLLNFFIYFVWVAISHRYHLLRGWFIVSIVIFSHSAPRTSSGDAPHFHYWVSKCFDSLWGSFCFTCILLCPPVYHRCGVTLCFLFDDLIMTRFHLVMFWCDRCICGGSHSWRRTQGNQPMRSRTSPLSLPRKWSLPPRRRSPIQMTATSMTCSIIYYDDHCIDSSVLF